MLGALSSEATHEKHRDATLAMTISPYLRSLREKVGSDLLVLPGAAAVVRDGDDAVLLVVDGTLTPDGTEVGSIARCPIADLPQRIFAPMATTAFSRLGWLGDRGGRSRWTGRRASGDEADAFPLDQSRR